MDVAIFGTMEEEDNVFESFDGEPGGVAVEMANAEGFARRRNGSLAVGGSDIRKINPTKNRSKQANSKKC